MIKVRTMMGFPRRVYTFGLTAFVLVALLLVPPASATPYEMPSPDTLLTFERTACFGPCPHYNLVVYEDGSLVYEGHREVKVEGVVKDTLSAEQIDALKAAFKEASFSDFRRSYTSGGPCEQVLMDAPTVRTFFQHDCTSHRVTHYRGCRGFPERDRLINLENEIDRIIGTEQWTGVER